MLTLTEKVKAKAFSIGADLVGIVSTKKVDAVSKHWIGWEIQDYTRQSIDYMEDSKSVIVLGYHAWDDIHELVVQRGNVKEFPAYHRMRLFTRRLSRFLTKIGYRFHISFNNIPELIFKNIGENVQVRHFTS